MINGTLRNARRVQPGEDPRAPCLSGEVYGDTKGRFFDGDYITTSTIVSEEGDVFKTRYSAYLVESWEGHPTEDALMVPGMGAQPVPVKEWVAANDNHPDWDGIVKTAAYRFSAVHETLAKSERGQYIGIPRPGDSNGCADDLVTTTFAPLEDLIGDDDMVLLTQDPIEGRGPFIQTYSGRQFFPLSPRPEEVHVEDIAHGLANICRYSGATIVHYSVAEHSVHEARWLLRNHGPLMAMHGLMHDAPEALSGFGDVGRPMKDYVPFVKQTEDLIWRQAVAPRFNLSAIMPAAVHEADNRIIADELAVLRKMGWHARHDDPLGVDVAGWSANRAETEFLEVYSMLDAMLNKAAA